MRLQLKFKEDASPSQRDELIADLGARGASDVRPLFPDADDALRSALYLVVANGASERQLLNFLEGADAVEFAEPEVRRRLARN